MRLFLLTASLLLTLAACRLPWESWSGAGIAHYARQLESGIRIQEDDVERKLAETVLPRQLFSGEPDDFGAPAVAWFLYDGDSLLAYSDYRLPMPELEALEQSRGLCRLADGWYEYFRGKQEVDGRKVTTVAMLALFREYPVQSPYLHSGFPLFPSLPAQLTWDPRPGGVPVHSNCGVVLGFLSSSLPLLPPLYRHVRDGLIIGAFLIFVFSFTGKSRYRTGWRSLLETILVAGVMRILFSVYYVPTAGSIFSWAGYPLGWFSLGDLLVFSILCFVAWWCLSPTLSLKMNASRRTSAPFFLSLFFRYAGAIFPLFLLALMVNSMELQAARPMEFENIFKLPPESIAAIIFLLACCIPFFHFSRSCIQSIRNRGAGNRVRLTAMAAALALAAPFVPLLDLAIFPVCLTGLIFLILLDLYADYRQQSLTWLVIWLIFYSATAAVLFFKYYLDRDMLQMQATAENLAVAPTTAPEKKLLTLQMTLREKLAKENFPAGFSPLDLEQIFERQWKQFPEIATRYRYRLRRVRYRGEDAADTAETMADGGYTFQLSVPDQIDWALQVTLLAREGRSGTISRIMAEGKMDYEQYDFAVFSPNGPVLSRGTPSRQWLLETPTAPGTLQRRISSNRADLLLHHSNGRKVVLGKDLGGYIRPLSLFSFFFVLLMLLVLILSTLQLLLGFRHSNYFALLMDASLRFRIQLAFLALIVGAFVLVGAVTANSFKRSSVSQYREQLGERLNILYRDLRNEWDTRPGTPYRQLIRSAGEIHRTEMALYNDNGTRLTSSAPFFFSSGIFPARMHPAALLAFAKNDHQLNIQPLAFDTPDLQIAYLALEPGRYLGVPFVSRAADPGSDLYAFIGTLVNVYVFLLLAASAIAIVVANSVTRPLVRLGAKLQQLRLGRNEPLVWKSSDEVGALVRAYNEMIVKLERSTEKLRRSEREGAWREMAKQVAHEIKNPLTPMKLSIQHLQRAFRANPEKAAGMIRRVTETLVEQIDGLARIAGEFSSFAKMPKAQNEPLDLNEVLTSVYWLFRNKSGSRVDLQLQLPQQSTLVFADRVQLVRIFNNLVTNSLQAIPPARHGQIRLELVDQSGWAVVRVRDNGAGIPEEMRQKVFFPNFTTKSSGMGLGLAMCKTIVEQAGGQIYFETEVGRGTVFSVELPLLEKKVKSQSRVQEQD